MEQRIETLHIQATRDPLTNVANRAEFDRVHAEFVNTHLQRGMPCALLICDIDRFKSVNDTYGHQAGDDVLVNFAALLQRAGGPSDLVARYGGEEFVMLCEDCDNATITQRAEKIRLELSDTPQPCLDNRPITASFGVTEIQAGDTPETMLRRADRALLKAKESGRNRVVQLGTGIPEDLNRDRRNVFRRWLHPTPSSHLLEETLVTAVPLAVTMEKLRGFISDHHAEIASTEDGKLRLQITKRAPTNRRNSDRPTSFILSLQFLEKEAKSERAPGRSRTIIRVSIQLANYRDRRLDNAYERARQLYSSLRSYFMAQTFDGHVDEDEASSNPTFLRRLLSLLGH
jgi:diguanylate cyclase (GGDEF)-like protein